jgi:hypothetical protein
MAQETFDNVSWAIFGVLTGMGQVHCWSWVWGAVGPRSEGMAWGQ